MYHRHRYVTLFLSTVILQYASIDPSGKDTFLNLSIERTELEVAWRLVAVWVMDPPPDHLSARSAGDRRPQPAHYCASAEEHYETTSYFMYFSHNIFIFTIYLPRVIKMKSICFESHTNFAIPSLFIYTHSKPHTHHESFILIEKLYYHCI